MKKIYKRIEETKRAECRRVGEGLRVCSYKVHIVRALLRTKVEMR
jgi:hypothetical protein